MAKLGQKRCLIFVNDFLPVSPVFIDHGRSVVYEKEKPQFLKERKYGERERDNNIYWIAQDISVGSDGLTKSTKYKRNKSDMKRRIY